MISEIQDDENSKHFLKRIEVLKIWYAGAHGQETPASQQTANVSPVLTPTPISIKLNRSDAVNSALCLENKFDALWADAPDVDMTVETQLPQESESEGEGMDLFAQKWMEKVLQDRLEQDRHLSKRLKRQRWDTQVYEVLQHKKTRKEAGHAGL